MRMSTEAEKRGLDKGPTFEEKMKLARMQILSGELNNALQEEARKITDGPIEDYYKKNAPTYEQATFMRMYVPRVKQSVPAVATPTHGTNPDVQTTEKTSAQ